MTKKRLLVKVTSMIQHDREEKGEDCTDGEEDEDSR